MAISRRKIIAIPAPDDLARWSTVHPLSAFAEVFGISTRTLARWFRAGIIRHRRLSRCLCMIDLDELPQRWRARFGGLEETGTHTNGQPRTRFSA